MVSQQVAQRRRSALIEEDAHSSCRESAACGVLQHGPRLLESDTGKQCNHFADRHTVFEVLEERGDGHTRAPKYPGSAHAFRVAFYSVTA